MIMDSKVVMLIVSVFALLGGGCASTPKRGQIFAGDSDNRVKIHMGHKELAVGDKVAFLEQSCTVPVRLNPEKCSTKRVAVGKVVESLNEHDSLVQIEGDARLSSQAHAERIDETEPMHSH